MKWSFIFILLLICRITFDLKSRFEFMESAKGEGVVICDNGESLPVIVKIEGSSLAFHHYKIEKAAGVFSEVEKSTKLLGSYAPTQGYAVGPKNPKKLGKVLYKKNITLTFTGVDGAEPFEYARGEFKIEQKK